MESNEGKAPAFLVGKPGEVLTVRKWLVLNADSRRQFQIWARKAQNRYIPLIALSVEKYSTYGFTVVHDQTTHKRWRKAIVADRSPRVSFREVLQESLERT